jgi:hypothetical protein
MDEKARKAALSVVARSANQRFADEATLMLVSNNFLVAG